MSPNKIIVAVQLANEIYGQALTPVRSLMLNAAAGGPNHHSSAPFSFKHEAKPFYPHPGEMADPSPSSSASPICIEGSEQDAALSKSELLSRSEVLKRRSRRLKQLARIYLYYYWAFMEEMRSKVREYYWEYGKSTFVQEEENERINSSRVDGTADNWNGNLGVNGGNGTCNVSSRCGVHGCKAKSMALTRFCHMHILSDAKQKLYKACTFTIKSSTTGPILCGKPILRSTVPSYCPAHFQKAERHMVRALKKSGLNIASVSKLAPKLHVIVSEYVRQILQKRRSAKRINLKNTEIKVENNC